MLLILLAMIRKLACFLTILLLSTQLNAQQSYRTALGLRINEGLGISLKHMMDDRQGVEGIIYTRWHGFNLTGLYAVHYPVFNEPGFRFYIGGGAHFGIFDGNGSPWWDDDVNDFVLGVDGQIGLEYTLDKIPLNLGLDWKPAINFIGSDDVWFSDLGLSVRYTWK